jgi:hypothetical protein
MHRSFSTSISIRAVTPAAGPRQHICLAVTGWKWYMIASFILWFTLRRCQQLDWLYTASNGSHRWIERNLEGSGPGLIKVSSSICLERLRQTMRTSLKRADTSVDIRTEHLPNTSLHRYHYANPARWDRVQWRVLILSVLNFWVPLQNSLAAGCIFQSILYLNVNLIFTRCLKKKRGSGDGVMTTELIHILWQEYSYKLVG